MSISTLLILDLKKNFNLQEKNVKFVNLNKGFINLKNSEQIFIKDYKKKKKFVLKIIVKISKSHN